MLNPQWPEWRQYREIEAGEQILAGGDCSAGGIDRSACQFVSKQYLDVPLVYHSPKLATEMTNAIFPVLEKISDITGYKPLVAYERQSGGVFEMERLAAMNRLGKYEIFKMPTIGREDGPEAVRYGWDTNSATRPTMLIGLKDAIDKKVLRVYDEQTIEEFFSFVIVKTSASWKAQAEKNAHDDLVMPLGIAWQLYLLSPLIQQSTEIYEDGEVISPLYKNRPEKPRYMVKRKNRG